MKCLLYIAGFLFAHQVSALTCPDWFVQRADDPLHKAVAISDYIFLGEAQTTIKKTIRSKDTELGILEIQTKFHNLQNIKGSLPSQFRIDGNLKGDCGCNYDFEPGVEYLVLANDNKGTLKTILCKFIQPAGSTSFIEEVRGKVEQQANKQRNTDSGDKSPTQVR